jgi:hypothetical protein
MTDANSKLVHLYYSVGKILDDNTHWGNKFIDNIC